MTKNLFYSNSYEYIKDLLKLLDLKIYKYILSENLDEAKAINPLKGLTITENEILRVFDEKEDVSSIKSDTINEISENIDELLNNINSKLNNSEEKGSQLSFEKLCNIFNLDYVERNMLLIGLSVELDPKYEKLYGFINDNINKKRASIDFALELMELSFEERITFRNKFMSDSFFKIFIYSKKVFENSETFFLNEIVIDNRIIDFILENRMMDSNLKDIITIYDPEVFFTEFKYRREVLENINLAIKNFINNKSYESNLIIYLCGDAGIGKKHMVRTYSNAINKEVMISDLKIIMMQAAKIKEVIFNILREAALRDSIICFDNFQCILDNEDKKDIILSEIFDAISYFMEPIFILSSGKYKANEYFSKNYTVVFHLETTNYEERLNLWEFYCSEYSIEGLNLEDLAAKFKFTPFQIKNTVESIRSKLLLDNIENKKLIYTCCYDQINSKLTEKAVRVKPIYTWEHLILPEEQKKLLRDACNQVKNRYIVYDKWNFGSKFGYGKGVAMIYTGPPGTGKTMSAQIIANELNLELYKIDLSQIVSKYIGETEKSLHEIFKEASLSNAILFFDEGDSLFGKRSEVKSSNDKYANLETSYLLQKIEEYDGVSIITTNFINNIDKAFLRRINYVVNYPFPDADSRKKIWQVMFSKDSPLDEEIDFEYLSETFEIAGGNIKNIVIYSAFLAAEKNEKISMKHILLALKYELQKMDKLLLAEDFGRYRYLLK